MSEVGQLPDMSPPAGVVSPSYMYSGPAAAAMEHVESPTKSAASGVAADAVQSHAPLISREAHYLRIACIAGRAKAAAEYAACLAQGTGADTVALGMKVDATAQCEANDPAKGTPDESPLSSKTIAF